MNISDATSNYEAWLGKRLTLRQDDLKHKHQAMAAELFPFMRATFYRWMQLWAQHCSKLIKAPEVLAVGDLHVENFGTWRDADGRLVWGINDFDEAFPLPYTIDLVRLATSAHLAIAAQHLAVPPEDACSAILRGYQECIEQGGRPFVLAEHHAWLRRLATSSLRDPQQFWDKLDSLVTTTEEPSKQVMKLLTSAFPKRGVPLRVTHRVAGLGSLGRERYVAVVTYLGGLMAREVKALAPSACVWAEGGKTSRIYYDESIASAVRCVDPLIYTRRDWLVRRLAPDCSRIELSSMPKVRDEEKLLAAMGWETANVHLGAKKAASKIHKHLSQLPKKWLHESAAEMAAATEKDWRDWKKTQAAAPQSLEAAAG